MAGDSGARGHAAADLTRLHAEIVKVLQSPEVKNWNFGRENEVIANSPREFTAFIRQEMAK